MPEIAVPQGTIRYQDEGQGPPIVFLHGYLMDSRLWDEVVERLKGEFRCIALDLPLGAHRVPMKPDADLSLRGLARLVADTIAALGLREVTLVGNDSGGGIAQVVAAEHPEHLGRLILTPSDCFDNCPPKGFTWLVPAARIPGLLTVVFSPMRWLKFTRRLPFTFGSLTTDNRRLDDLVTAWLAAFYASKEVRRDVVKVTRGLDPAITQDAAEKLTKFDKPTLLAWAPEDRLFPLAHAERLARIMPDARVEHIPNSLTFVMRDQPERTAHLIAAFMKEPRS